MKKFICAFLFIFNLLASYGYSIESAPTIHVFGDSHCSAFLHIPGTELHWLQGRTMHRVGRDRLDGLRVSDYGVIDGQIAVFTFGEIDVRCHVYKQIDKFNRSLDEIISSLAIRYLQTILLNRASHKNLTCIVYSVIPPTDNYYPEYFYGTLQERVIATKLLNQKLAELCKVTNIPFLDIYDDYSNADGSLNAELSDGTVHINVLNYQEIYIKLYKILSDLGKL